MKSPMEIPQTRLNFMQAVGVEVSIAKSPKVRCEVSIAVSQTWGAVWQKLGIITQSDTPIG